MSPGWVILTSVHRSSCSSTTLPRKPSPPVNSTVPPLYCCLTDRPAVAAAAAAFPQGSLMSNMNAQLQRADRAKAAQSSTNCSIECVAVSTLRCEIGRGLQSRCQLMCYLHNAVPACAVSGSCGQPEV
jgi:hypothetical protein